MYPYVPYVTRMLLVCYPYVLVWCFSHDPDTTWSTGTVIDVIILHFTFQNTRSLSEKLRNELDTENCSLLTASFAGLSFVPGHYQMIRLKAI